MSFLGGLTGAQRDAELLRQDAEAKQERLQADAVARTQRRAVRTSWLRQLLLRRRTK